MHRKTIGSFFLLLATFSAGAVQAEMNACPAIPENALSFKLQLTKGPIPEKIYQTGLSIPGGKSDIRVTIDTGSTGIVVSSHNVPPQTFAESTKEGHILYNSSNKYFAGKTIRTQVGFTMEDNRTVQTTPIDILAVSCECRVSQTAPTNSTKPHPAQCSTYNGTAPTKGAKNSSLTQCQPARDSIAMMGVGFDRQGRTSSINPFLNLVVPPEHTIHPGYIISERGLFLGLTNDNIKPFKMLQLKQKNVQSSVEWSQPMACTTISAPNGTPAAKLCGGFLMDTGIDFMFLSFSSDQRPPQSTADSKGPFDGAARTILAPGWKSTVSITGSTPDPLFSYSQTAVQTDQTPGSGQTVAVWAGANSKTGFMNTGRRLLQSGAYLFDQQCGRMGFAAY